MSNSGLQEGARTSAPATQPLKLLVLPDTTFHPQETSWGAAMGPSLSIILLTGDGSHPACPSRLIGKPRLRASSASCAMCERLPSKDWCVFLFLNNENQVTSFHFSLWPPGVLVLNAEPTPSGCMKEDPVTCLCDLSSLSSLDVFFISVFLCS